MYPLMHPQIGYFYLKSSLSSTRTAPSPPELRSMSLSAVPNRLQLRVTGCGGMIGAWIFDGIVSCRSE
jgi:hypothetical protein